MILALFIASITALAQVSADTCTSAEFTCLDGTCIDMSLLCDGKKDCPDASDEVFSACYNVTCSGFRCNYGGCIDSSLKCDDINDCWDSSDENKFLCANETTLLELLTDLRGNCTNEYAMQCPRTNRCLHWSNVCDGVGDCKNAEDEDKNICGVTFCASGSFQCQSGSCIGKDRLCDHNADCFDGSDEMPAICRQKTGSKAVEWFTKSCALVPKQGMRVTDYFSQLSYKQDAQVPDQSIVEITCDDGYRLFGSNINSCDNGAWENNLISCVRYCEPSPYSRSIAYSTKCSDVGDCNEGSLMDTEMLVSCAPGYESDSADNLVGHHVCDENGEWTVLEANPICTPICGVKSPHHPGITPWTVSLFQRTLPGDVIYTFKCMGTILSPFIVITADACFSEAAEAYSPLFFKVVEGDHKIEFREDVDHGYTLHNLMEIHIVTYRYSYKAALLRVIKPFIFGARVRPACLPTLYFVASRFIKYNVRNFITAIINDISKSEQNL